MGWGGGVSLFDEVMDIVLPRVDPANRPEVVGMVKDKFCDFDADTWDESKYFDAYHDIFGA